ncbi:CLUMA_CG007642, isoform A [Clunio marinus]|uniref:CLUMA_CG007642, isoform A n=1 Tax=Clunio marinus TaxID=568069 RepID=A0A1J1I193_9DIPT|nr:CLUMA_CG007642, isoform A [Clunio marinus]
MHQIRRSWNDFLHSYGEIERNFIVNEHDERNYWRVEHSSLANVKTCTFSLCIINSVKLFAITEKKTPLTAELSLVIVVGRACSRTSYH